MEPKETETTQQLKKQKIQTTINTPLTPGQSIQ